MNKVTSKISSDGRNITETISREEIIIRTYYRRRDLRGRDRIVGFTTNYAISA